MRPGDSLTYIGTTYSRGMCIPFGIKEVDRSRHIYIIGKTGVGKSTLIESLAIQDLENGNGVIFFDPHGSSAEELLKYIPEDRVKDTIYFSPTEIDSPIAFNIMEDIGYDKRHLVAGNLLSAFKKIWGEESFSDRMSHILNNTLLALLEYPNTTLLDVRRMYIDKEFRKQVVDVLKDPQVKSYWVDEYTAYTERVVAEATPAIQNKLGQFTSNPVIRNIVGQSKSAFDIRDVMDKEKILIVNFKKGLLGDDNASMLGVLLSTKIYLTALSRADLTRDELSKTPASNFYIDEFQSFSSDTFANVLSEARKYKLNLVIAHQFIDQLEETVRNAVFGNVGTHITFRVGPLDADVLEKVYAPRFEANDLLNLGRGQIYITLAIDGIGSQPFSATTEMPPSPSEVNFEREIMEYTNKTYGTERAEVEDIVKKKLEKNWTRKKLDEDNKKNKPNRKYPKYSGDKKQNSYSDNKNHQPSRDFSTEGLEDLIKNTQATPVPTKDEEGWGGFDTLNNPK